MWWVVTNVTDKHSVSLVTSTLQMVAVYPFEMTVATYTAWIISASGWLFKKL